MAILLQGGTSSDELAFAVAYLIAGLIILAVTITVGILIHRDAKRRGASPGTWIVVWIVLSLLGFLGWAIFALVYLTARPKQILYDAKGNPLLPAIPPGPYQGAPPPPGWTQAPPPGWGQPGWQQAAPPGAYPPQAPVAPPPAGAKATKVKCPRCHTIFDYYAAPVGPTHVKCPACGEEGNI